MYHIAHGTVTIPSDNWHLAMETRAVHAELHPEVVTSEDESLHCNEDISPTIGESELEEVPCLFVHYSPVQNLIMVEMDFEKSEPYLCDLFPDVDSHDEDELVFACFRPGQGHKEAIFILPLDKYVVRNDEEISLSQIRYIMHIAELRLK